MNKMAEKNDQKMRERAERAEKFQAKLQELLALAKKQKKICSSIRKSMTISRILP